MSDKMQRFTDEERAIIKANPYTAIVTEAGIVKFTVDFKKFAFNEYIHHTKPSEIFVKAGYGKIFTSMYMSKVLERIRKEAQSEEGFKDPLKSKTFENKALEKMKYEKAIKELQEHIVYLEQEIDFLKKISILNNQQK